MLKWRTVLSFLCLHLLTESVLARQCFYPNGSPSKSDVPCGDDESVDTHCCNKGSICLDNRLCLNAVQPYALSRQSCTNQNWSDKCSAQCIKYTRDVAATIFLLTEDGAKEQWTYCCNQVVSTGKTGNATCLHADDGSFHVEGGEIMYGYARLQGIQDPSTNTTTPTPSNRTTNTSSSSSSSRGGNSHEREIAIGAGVGIPLGLIAAAAIAWGIYERMQKRKALKTAAVGPVPFAGELQPMMKSDSYTHTPPPPAAAPVELEQRNHHIPELQGTPRM